MIIMILEKKDMCPVCGEKGYGDFWTCEHCEWCNDPAQRKHPDLKNFENKMSLNEARKAYKEGRPIE